MVTVTKQNLNGPKTYKVQRNALKVKYFLFETFKNMTTSAVNCTMQEIFINIIYTLNNVTDLIMHVHYRK